MLIQKRQPLYRSFRIPFLTNLDHLGGGFKHCICFTPIWDIIWVELPIVEYCTIFSEGFFNHQSISINVFYLFQFMTFFGKDFCRSLVCCGTDASFKFPDCHLNPDAFPTISPPCPLTGRTCTEPSIVSGSDSDCYIIGHHEFAIAEDDDRNRSCHHVHCNLWTCISKTWWHWDIEHWRDTGEHCKKPVNLLVGDMLVGVIKEFFDMATANIKDGFIKHIVECRHESM